MITPVDREEGVEVLFRAGKEGLTDMAMHKPHSWIIGPERNSQITSSRQKGYVPSWGICEVEGTDTSIDIIRCCTLSKNGKVVAVKMDRVGILSRNLEWKTREVLGGNDKVDITLRVVLWDYCVFCTECCVVEI